MKTKRLLAYLIDFIIIFLITLIIPISDKTLKLNNDMINLNNSIIEQKINYNEYLTQYKKLNYKVDKSLIFNNFINLIIIFLYFVIVPFKLKGQTLAMKIFKIKINDYKMSTLIKRSLFINFIMYMFINLIIIIILKENAYFYANFILTILSFLLVILSGFMVLYRQDEKGIQDVLTKSVVIKN